jgi:hypothetical protein
MVAQAAQAHLNMFRKLVAQRGVTMSHVFFGGAQSFGRSDLCHASLLTSLNCFL